MSILRDYTPQEGLDFEEELTVEGLGILNHALTHVKGLVVENLGMWTRSLMEPLDDCEKCQGARGGVLGNENIMPDGRILCDYCTVEEAQPVLEYLDERDAAPTAVDFLFEKETGALVPTDELVQILPKENEDVPREESNPRHYPEGD